MVTIQVQKAVAGMCVKDRGKINLNLDAPGYIIYTVDSLLTHSSHNPYSLKPHGNWDFPSWFAGVMG